MSTEHDSLIGSAYNDGYDEGYRDGMSAAVLKIRFYLSELVDKELS